MKNWEFSRWLLSIGYLTLAIVILINFIRQSPEGMRPRVINLTSPSQAADIEQLKSQLEQEKQLNRNLRKMLNEYQQAFSQLGTTTGNNLPELNLKSFEDIIRQGIPKISASLTRNLEEKPSPFIPGKNPYLSFLPVKKRNDNSLPKIEYNSNIQIRCDPHIPLIMQFHPFITKTERLNGIHNNKITQ